MKYLGLLITMCLVVSLLFTACQPGIAQDDVDVDMDEIDALEAEVDSLLDFQEEDFSDLESSLETL